MAPKPDILSLASMSTPRRTSNRLKALAQGHVCDKDTLAVGSPKALPASLLVTWGSRRLVVRRQPDYAATIASVTSARTMKELKKSSFHFEAIVPEHGEEMCEITDEAWSDTVWSLRSVTVVLDEAAVRPTLVFHPTPGHIVPATPTNHPYCLYVKTLDRKTLTIVCNPHDSVESVKGKIQDQEGICVRKQRLISSGQELRDDKRTLQSYNIRTGYTLHLVNRLMGGKPVIYILSPITLEDISVSLALTAGWSFTTLYPDTTVVSEEHKDTVHWVVDASPDGTLLDRRSGLQILYLFWEAETHPALAPPDTWAPSRPACPCCDALVKFDPSRPSLTPEHAVLLSSDEVAMYLDHALKALTLNTEARTSFITYWLPSLLKHQNIALRFLPQNVYEAAAPMDITPVPDVVTRVFMLFRGIEEEDLEKWAQAKMRADYSDVSFWTNIIGIDVEKASNESLYRVLEWGGMEIR